MQYVVQVRKTEVPFEFTPECVGRGAFNVTLHYLSRTSRRLFYIRITRVCISDYKKTEL